MCEYVCTRNFVSCNFVWASFGGSNYFENSASRSIGVLDREFEFRHELLMEFSCLVSRYQFICSAAKMITKCEGLLINRSTRNRVGDW